MSNLAIFRLKLCLSLLALYFIFAATPALAVNAPVITHVMGKPVVAGATHYANVSTGIEVRGNAEALTTIRLFKNGSYIGTDITDATGVWSISFSSSDSTADYNADANDGTFTSAKCPSVKIQVDTQPPYGNLMSGWPYTFVRSTYFSSSYYYHNIYDSSTGSGLDYDTASMTIIDVTAGVKISTNVSTDYVNRFDFAPLPNDSAIKIDDHEYVAYFEISDNAGNRMLASETYFCDLTNPVTNILKIYDPDHATISGTGEPNPNPPDADGWVNYYPNMTITYQPTKILGYTENPADYNSGSGTYYVRGYYGSYVYCYLSNGMIDSTGSFTLPINSKFYTDDKTVSFYTVDCAYNSHSTNIYLKFVNPCPDPEILKVYDPAHHDFSGVGETSANTPDANGYVDYFPNMKISTTPTTIIGKIDPTNMVRFYLTNSLMPSRNYYVGSEIDATTGSFTALLDGDFWNGGHSFSFRIYNESGGYEYRYKTLYFIDGNLPPPGRPALTEYPWGGRYPIPTDQRSVPEMKGNAVPYAEPQVIWAKGRAGGIITAEYQYATVVLPSGQVYPNIPGTYDQGDVWQDKNQNGQWDSDEAFFDMPPRGTSDGKAFSIVNFLNIEPSSSLNGSYLFDLYARSPHYDSSVYYARYWYSDWDNPHTIKKLTLTPYHSNPYRTSSSKPTNIVLEVSKPTGNYSPSQAYGLKTAVSPVSVVNFLGNDSYYPPSSNWSYVGTPDWYKTTIDLSATTFPEGTYRIKADLINEMNVINIDDTNFFKIDNTAPMAQDFSPAEGAVSNSFTSFNAKVVDPYLADNSEGSGLNLDVALSQIWPFRLLTNQLYNTKNVSNLTFTITDAEPYAKNHRGEILTPGTVLDAWKVISGQYQNDTIAVKVDSNSGDGTLKVSTVSGANFAKNNDYVVLFAIPSFTSNNGIDRVGAVPITPVSEDAQYVCRVLTLDKSGNMGAFYAPYSRLELAAGPITLTTDRTFLFYGLMPPDIATFTSSSIYTRKGNIVADGQTVTIQRSPESLTMFTLPDANGLPGDGYQVYTGENGAPAGQGQFVYGIQVTGSANSTLNTVCGIGLASGSSTPIPIVQVGAFILSPATTTPAITPGNPTGATSVSCSTVGYSGTPVPDGTLATWTVTDHLLDNPTAAMYSMNGYHTSYWYPDRMSDGNIWTYGQYYFYDPSFSAPMPGSGFTVDLGEGNEKEWVRLEAKTNSTSLDVEFNIQYSDDSVNWTTVFTDFIPTGTSWTQASWPHSGKHRFWRLIQTNIPTYYWSYLCELSWFSNPAQPTVSPDASPAPGLQASLVNGLSTVFVSALSKGPVTFKMEVAGRSDECTLTFLDRYPPDPPDILAVSPQYNQGTVQLTWTESPDYAGAGTKDYFIEQSFNSGAYAEVLNVATITGSITGLADGEYLFRVKARDNDNNVGNPSVASFCVVDTVAPPAADCSDIGPGNLDPDEHFSVDPNITFYFSPTDDRSGVAEVNVQVATASDFSQLAHDVWIPVSTSYQFTGGISGYDYYARVRVKDRSGNIGPFGAASNGIRVHYTGATTPPNAPIITTIDSKTAIPGNPVKTNKTTGLAIEGMSESSNLVELWVNGSYVESVIAAVDGKFTHLLDLPQGNYWVKVRSHNGFAQSAFSGQFQIIIDTTPPSMDLRMYITGNHIANRNWVSRTGNDHNLTHFNLFISDSGGAGFDINVASISIYDIDDSGVPLPSTASYPNPLVGAASPIAADTAQFIPDAGWPTTIQDQHRYRVYYEVSDYAGNVAYNSRDIAIDSLKPGYAVGVPATSTPPFSNFREIYVYNTASYPSGLPPYSELVPTYWNAADNVYDVDPTFTGNSWVDNSTSPVALLFNSIGIYGRTWTAMAHNPPPKTNFDTFAYSTGIAWGWGTSISLSNNVYGHNNWYDYDYRTIVNGIHECTFYLQDSGICREKPKLRLNIQSPTPAPHPPQEVRFYDASDPSVEYPTMVWNNLFSIPGNWMYAMDNVITDNANPLLIKVKVPIESFDQTVEFYYGNNLYLSALVPAGSDMVAPIMELTGTDYRRKYQIRTRANGYVSMNLPRELKNWYFGYVKNDTTPPQTSDLIPVEENYNAKTGATAKPFPTRFSVRIKDTTDGSNLSYLHIPDSKAQLQDSAGNPITGVLTREYDAPTTAYGFRYDLSTAPTAEGTYYYYLQLTDAAQPTANTFLASFPYRLDTKAPKPENVSPADGAITNSLPSFSCQSVDQILADGTPGSGPNMDPSLVQVEPFKELGRGNPTNSNTIKVQISGIDTVATDHVDNVLPVGTLVYFGKVQGSEIKQPQRSGLITSNGGDFVTASLVSGSAFLTTEEFAVIWPIPSFQSNDGIDRLAAVPIQPAVKGGAYVAYFSLTDKSLNTGTYSSASSIYEAAYGTFALTPDRTTLYAGLIPPHAANYVSDPIMTTEGNTVQPGTMVTVFTQPPIGAFGPADANGIPGDGHQVSCDAAGKLNFQLLASGTAVGTANVKAVIGLANGSDNSVSFVQLPGYSVTLSQPSLVITSAVPNPSLTISAGTFGNAGDLVPNNTMLNCQASLGSFLPADAMAAWPGHQVPITGGSTSLTFSSDTAGTANLTFECGNVTVTKTVNIIDQAPPTAPGTPSISPMLSGTGNLLVTWGAATDPGNSGIANYELEYSLNGGAWVNCAVVSIPVFNTSDLTHGLYKFRSRAKDTAGNVGPYSAESAQVEVDRLPPAGSIVVNSGQTVTATTSVTLTLTSSDANGVAGMAFSNDGTTWSSWQAPATSFSWKITSGDGNKIVFAQFKDSLGNISIPYQDGIRLDTTAPNGSITIAETPYTSSTTVNLSINAIDATGISFMYLQNQGQPAVKLAYASAYLWNLTSGDGNKTVFYSFEDSLGNRSASDTVSTILDNTGPTKPVVTDDGDYSPFIDKLHASWTSSDSLSGISHFLVKVGTAQGLADVVAETNVGNASETTFTGLTLDLSGTTIYYFTVTAVDKGGATSLAGYSNGIKGGDPTPPEPVTVNDDGDYTADSGSLHATWGASTDPDSGINRYEFSAGTSPGATDLVAWVNLGIAYEYTATGLSMNNGQTYYINIRIFNNGGVSSTNVSNGIVVDTAPPPTPVLVAEPTYTGNFSNTLTCNAVVDAISGGVQYYFERATDAAFTLGMANSGWIAANSYNFTGLTHGTTYYFRVKARDAVGNETVVSGTESSFQDNQAPSCTVYTDNIGSNNDPDGTWSRDLVVSFAPDGLTFDYAPVKNVYLQIDNENTFTAPLLLDEWINNTNGAYTFTAPDVDGSKIFARARFEDEAGNISAYYTTDGITIDKSKPIANATDDVNGNNDNDHTVSADKNVTFNFSYSDAVSGVADIYVQVASDTAFTEIAFEGWLSQMPLPTYYLFTNGADNSIYYARIMVKDYAGNISDWGARSDGIRIDLSAPGDTGGEMFLINKKPGLYASETSTASPSVFLTLTISDPSGVQSAAVSNDNTNWTIWNNPVLDPASHSWNLSSGEGTKTIYMYFVDGVGHISPVKTQSIDYRPFFKILAGDRDDKTYPVDTYDEYRGQNKYGTDRSKSNTADTGKSLKLETP